jgi:hypothetical protein
VNERLAALDFITACLGVRSTSAIDGFLRSTILSEHFNWQAVIKMANTQRVTPALWVALRNRGLIESLPLDVREYLRQVHRLNTLRNLCLKAQAIEAVRQLNAIGIEPVLLKGGAYLLIEMFDDLGSRVMVDLDILVPQKAAEDCWNTLRSLGYCPIEDNPDYYVDYSVHHHLRPLYRSGECGKIEIHRDVLPQGTAHLLPTQLVWMHVEPIEESGVTMGVLSPTYRILHNLLHSNLVNRAYARGNLSLRSLHELVMTQAVFNECIDWKTIRQLMDRGGQVKILHAWLYLAHRWFGSPLPDPIRATLGAAAHYARSRLQARWDWTEKLVDQAMWFSAQDIRERYKCNGSFWFLTRGRLRLAAHLSYQYGSRGFRWVASRIGSALALGIWQVCSIQFTVWGL